MQNIYLKFKNASRNISKIFFTEGIFNKKNLIVCVFNDFLGETHVY
jgi:hypothetical protein